MVCPSSRSTSEAAQSSEPNIRNRRAVSLTPFATIIAAPKPLRHRHETVTGLSPAGWARKAIALWRKWEADCLIVEVNQGGDMVRAVIHEADRNVPVTPVRAHRGKYLRAEPVANLYEQGRVRHAGIFAALEDEMCDFGVDGLSSGRSPDRLDALVWAVTALTYAARGEPRIRGL